MGHRGSRFKIWGLGSRLDRTKRATEEAGLVGRFIGCRIVSEEEVVRRGLALFFRCVVVAKYLVLCDDSGVCTHRNENKIPCALRWSRGVGTRVMRADTVTRALPAAFQ